ncbi:HU family DNA-binding protein [Chlorobaculum sp. 24CR]|uniref:HU family DNA-binding protein n=1 Tax=Chlorobaculum sp. 24CR TaxID=2508878 RepID=UPI00210F9064|nr:HU family DNA-binding protein [Chlorobaculum sp. 24CR]
MTSQEPPHTRDKNKLDVCWSVFKLNYCSNWNQQADFPPTVNGKLLMSKAELVEQIAEQTGLTKADSERAVNAFINVVASTLKSGDDVTLVGFGTFTTGERAERQGRNPQTGETITISAKKVVKFKPGKALKDEVGG